MKDTLKYLTFLIALAIVVYVIIRVDSCSRAAEDQVTVRIPSDSAFAPVVERNFRPVSTPFERSVKAPVRLPKGLTQANVARIVRVIKRIPVDSIGSLVDTTTVILMKAGEVFVPKQDGIETMVEQTSFLPPVIRVSAFVGVGISLSKLGIPSLEVSPVVAIAPLEFYGKVHLPIVALDLEGPAVGAGWREKDFVFCILSHWKFETADRSIRLSVHYLI